MDTNMNINEDESKMMDIGVDIMVDGSNLTFDHLTQKLMYIDENLGRDDLNNFKFLCADIIPKSVLERATRAQELFPTLEARQQNMSTMLGFIVESLYHMGCIKLIREAFGFTKQHMENRLSKMKYVTMYRSLMFDISENLTKKEFQDVYFLMRNKIPPAVQDSIKNTLDLFISLEKAGEISSGNCQIVLTMCQNIKREDLVKKVMSYIQNGDSQGRQELTPEQLIDHRRDNASPRQSSPIRYAGQQTINTSPRQSSPIGYASQPSAPAADESTTGTFTQQTMPITQSHGDGVTASNHNQQNPSESQTQHIENQLKHPIQETGDMPSQSPNIESYSSQYSVGNIAVNPVTANMMNVTCLPTNSETPPTNKAKKQPESDFLEYKMNARPRGLCIIINNEKFYQASKSSKCLEPRQVSQQDVTKLKDCFTNLDFTVTVHENLRSDEMVQVMDTTARKNHSDHDCFVCCILTHGGEGRLYGAEGLTVGMDDMTYPFKSIRCHSLAAKPKLFFVQACRGKDKQEGATVKRDFASCEEEFLPKESIPNEADFVLSYATGMGTWYISTLTSVLNKYKGTEDLASMLVKVNYDVSQEIAKMNDDLYKQVPEPLITLRKKLFFR